MLQSADTVVATFRATGLPLSPPSSSGSSLTLCVRVNGSSVGCGALALGGAAVEEDVVFSAAAWGGGAGRSWLSLELREPWLGAPHDNAGALVAAARPVAVTVVTSKQQQQLLQQQQEASVAIERARNGPCGSPFGSSPFPGWPSVTMVLTLTLRDLPRATVLFSSLAQQMRCSGGDGYDPDDDDDENDAGDEPCWLAGLLVIVPDGEAAAFASVLEAAQHPACRGQQRRRRQQRRRLRSACVEGCAYSAAVAAEAASDHEAANGAEDDLEGECEAAPWRPVRIVPEGTLLGRRPTGRSSKGGGGKGDGGNGGAEDDSGGPALWDTYAVAMALKLLAATLVETDFYLTLDSDLVATRRLRPEDLFVATPPHPRCPRGASSVAVGGGVEGDGVEGGESGDEGLGAGGSGWSFRAWHAAEPQAVHPHWWAGSAVTLQHQAGGGGEGGSEFSVDPAARFGVTPAVLSTAGALSVLARLRDVHGGGGGGVEGGGGGGVGGWVSLWLEAWGPGRWWSEYTLYALELRRLGLFDLLHARHATSHATSHARGNSTGGGGGGGCDGGGQGAQQEPSTELSCRSAWFARDLPWDAASAFGGGGGTSEGDGGGPACPFAVVQSSSGASVQELAAAVAAELDKARWRRGRSGRCWEEAGRYHLGEIFARPHHYTT